eukprot:923622-Rhodomonas_salina.1
MNTTLPLSLAPVLPFFFFGVTAAALPTLEGRRLRSTLSPSTATTQQTASCPTASSPRGFSAAELEDVSVAPQEKRARGDRETGTTACLDGTKTQEKREESPWSDES